jgi:hypothetical protein
VCLFLQRLSDFTGEVCPFAGISFFFFCKREKHTIVCKEETHMRNMYSDPTAGAAMGSLDKELDRMRKKVKELRALRRAFLLTPEFEARARSRFPTGMVRRLFDAEMAAPDTPEELGEIPEEGGQAAS